ncbi:glycosyltransferase [Clostridiaceae bacterium]|nr:glycosyltransferase [Clostridiaceae bacterium]RKI16902.1 glycosyltransferase [bacterium 1XD21-70]
MQILIFGVGKIYQENKKHISESERIIAFLDNDPTLWETEIDNIIVRNPGDILEIAYDKIILMSDYAPEMRKQLLSLGCKEEDIVHYTEYLNGKEAGKLQIFLSNEKPNSQKGKVLIISDTLGYHGGALAAVYAAQVLRIHEYNVMIAAPDSDSVFIEEMKKSGIGFILYRNLAHIKKEELVWINDFQYIIVNTLPMICCATEIAKNRKVILWLHESPNVYRSMQYWDEKIEEGIASDKLKIYAVSSIAKKNFIQKYPNKEIRLLPYGIPQECRYQIINKNKKLVFAIIGALSEQKGQDIFLDAAEQVNADGKQGEFWIIGKRTKSSYGKSIEERARRNPNVHIIGELTRAEMIRHYQKIDVLIVASREETMSIVATEAMMQGKVCIVSNIAGMADYIKDYHNGLLFETENSDELSKRILWCMENIERFQEIGKEAKLTYEQNFSMGAFGKRLEAIIGGDL